MTAILDQIAKRVVINFDQHQFTIDGQDFPWLVSDTGPVVGRLAEDLYRVGVEILLVAQAPDFRHFDFTYLSDYGGNTPHIPVINGERFPWLLTDDNCQLAFGHKILPSLKLTFLASSVESDRAIDDYREQWSGRAIWCSGGHLIREGKDPCYWCGDLYDRMEMLEHHLQAHPEHVGSCSPTGRGGYRIN